MNCPTPSSSSSSSNLVEKVRGYSLRRGLNSVVVDAATHGCESCSLVGSDSRIDFQLMEDNDKRFLLTTNIRSPTTEIAQAPPTDNKTNEFMTRQRRKVPSYRLMTEIMRLNSTVLKRGGAKLHMLHGKLVLVALVSRTCLQQGNEQLLDSAIHEFQWMAARVRAEVKPLPTRTTATTRLCSPTLRHQRTH